MKREEKHPSGKSTGAGSSDDFYEVGKYPYSKDPFSNAEAKRRKDIRRAMEKRKKKLQQFMLEGIPSNIKRFDKLQKRFDKCFDKLQKTVSRFLSKGERILEKAEGRSSRLLPRFKKLETIGKSFTIKTWDEMTSAEKGDEVVRQENAIRENWKRPPLTPMEEAKLRTAVEVAFAYEEHKS